METADLEYLIYDSSQLLCSEASSSHTDDFTSVSGGDIFSSLEKVLDCVGSQVAQEACMFFSERSDLHCHLGSSGLRLWAKLRQIIQAGFLI